MIPGPKGPVSMSYDVSRKIIDWLVQNFEEYYAMPFIASHSCREVWLEYNLGGSSQHFSLNSTSRQQ